MSFRQKLSGNDSLNDASKKRDSTKSQKHVFT